MKNDSQPIPAVSAAQYVVLDSGARNETFQDEIDLVDVFRIIWNGRLRLCSIASIVIFIALVAVFAISPTYQSKAIIAPPSIADIKTFLPLSISGFAITNKTLFDQFSALAKSQVAKKEFFDVQHDSIDTISTGNDLSFEAFEKSIDVKSVRDKESGIETLTLSFEGNDDVGGPKLLKAYIELINTKTIDNITNDFNAFKYSQITTLEAKIKALRAEEKLRLKFNVINYSNALIMAKSLNIKKPLSELSGLVDNQSNKMALNYVRPPLYSLGYEYISKKLEEMKSTKNIDAGIDQMPALLSKLAAVNEVKLYSEKSKSYTYLAAPLDKAQKIKPKGPLIVILAAILGLFIGVIVVLVEAKMKESNAPNLAEKG